ncbi:MAG TPA: hypothetical protein ENH82_06875 [bacterium]|nr:hypothetical protein [bacterium]
MKKKNRKMKETIDYHGRMLNEIKLILTKTFQFIIEEQVDIRTETGKQLSIIKKELRLMWDDLKPKESKPRNGKIVWSDNKEGEPKVNGEIQKLVDFLNKEMPEAINEGTPVDNAIRIMRKSKKDWKSPHMIEFTKEDGSLICISVFDIGGIIENVPSSGNAAMTRINLVNGHAIVVIGAAYGICTRIKNAQKVAGIPELDMIYRTTDDEEDTVTPPSMDRPTKKLM